MTWTMCRLKEHGYLPGNLHAAIVLSLCIVLSVMSHAQAQNPADVNDISTKYLELGKRQFEYGEYEMAEESFKTVLENIQVLPAEICYYFGANSYHLHKYKQSINWLNKYIELKGTSGRYFDECTEYLDKAEEKYRASRRSVSTPADSTTFDDLLVDYESLPDIDCGPTGKVLCPVCKGNTVIIRRDVFGKGTYRTCPYCDDHGYLTCEQYNLLLKGELQPNEDRSVE